MISVSETKYSLLITVTAVTRELVCIKVYQVLFPKREFEEDQMTATHAVKCIIGEEL